MPQRKGQSSGPKTAGRRFAAPCHRLTTTEYAGRENGQSGSIIFSHYATGHPLRALFAEKSPRSDSTAHGSPDDEHCPPADRLAGTAQDNTHCTRRACVLKPAKFARVSVRCAGPHFETRLLTSADWQCHRTDYSSVPNFTRTFDCSPLRRTLISTSSPGFFCSISVSKSSIVRIRFPSMPMIRSA